MFFQSRVDRLFQSRVVCQYLSCLFGRRFQYLRILEHIRDLKVQDPALTDAEQIPRSSEPQILAGNEEPVIGMVQDFQPLFCLFGL